MVLTALFYSNSTKSSCSHIILSVITLNVLSAIAVRRAMVSIKSTLLLSHRIWRTQLVFEQKCSAVFKTQHGSCLVPVAGPPYHVDGTYLLPYLVMKKVARSLWYSE